MYQNTVLSSGAMSPLVRLGFTGIQALDVFACPQVSLDSRVRDVINRNMTEPTSHTFDDAQQQIYTLMQRDSYPRYMNSSIYSDLLHSLEQQQQQQQLQQKPPETS